LLFPEALQRLEHAKRTRQLARDRGHVTRGTGSTVNQHDNRSFTAIRSDRYGTVHLTSLLRARRCAVSRCATQE
jgi:hypothetical protein